MNKNMAGILSAAAVLTMLAGCTAYDRTKDQFVQPVVKDVKKGMSRAQVAQTGLWYDHKPYNPPAWLIPPLHSEFLPYSCSYSVLLFISVLDDTGHVINSGYQTCAEYDTDPQAAK